MCSDPDVIEWMEYVKSGHPFRAQLEDARRFAAKKLAHKYALPWPEVE